MKIDISVIIVSFNTKKVLIGCLEMLEKFLDKGCCEVIVVDNNSSDGTVEALKADFGWVKVIENKENIGFGRANNQGAKAATGKYLWILNGDTLLLDKGYKIMVEFLEDHPEIGAIGPRLVLEDKKTEQEGQYGKDPGFGNLLFRTMNQEIEVNGAGFGETDWVTGAALMIRRDLYEKIGGFNNQFMLYFEDTDLCRRVREHGYKVGWLSSVTVVHLGGRSTTGWERKTYYYQSQEKYFGEYYGKMSVYLLKLLRLPIFIANYIKLKGWKKV